MGLAAAAQQEDLGPRELDLVEERSDGCDGRERYGGVCRDDQREGTGDEFDGGERFGTGICRER